MALEAVNFQNIKGQIHAVIADEQPLNKVFVLSFTEAMDIASMSGKSLDGGNFKPGISLQEISTVDPQKSKIFH